LIMNLTWGFILFFVYVLFPGLIIRRLYFYGDFSKQFGHHEPILKILLYALVPGLINLCLGYWLFVRLFSGVSSNQVVSTLNSIKVFLDGKGLLLPVTFDYVRSNGLKMLGHLYIMAFILGSLSGPLVRVLGLDLRFKLFRYKNTWFYVFHGLHDRIKRDTYKRTGLKTPKRTFILANVDILLNVKNGENLTLYSGIIVDYELDATNPQELSKVVLYNAKRYKNYKNSKRYVSKDIPGSLFVVDCKNMVNINITYVYGVYEELLKARFQSFARYWNNVLSIFSLFLFVPAVVFKLRALNLDFYDFMFEITWYQRLVVYLYLIQILHLFNVFVEDDGEFRFINGMEWILKLIVTFILGVISYIIWI